MISTRANANNGTVDYGFGGSKVIHTLGLAGILLVAAAAYLLTGGIPTAAWLIGIAVIGVHIGAWLLFGAGFLFWVFRFGRFIMRDRQLAKIPWRGDEQVLDVGCGAGILTVGAAKFLNTGRAVGIDIWAKNHGQTFTPDLARANAEVENVGDRVEVRDGDARDMDFPDASFDVVLSSFALHHIDRDGREAAVREIVRVMKPGGRLVLLDAQHTGIAADALRAAGAEDVVRTRVVPLVPGLRWVTARKPT